MNADLDHFERVFARSSDPWGTRVKPAEAVKRAAIEQALPARPIGRVLELASGNGSNSRMLARHALRLDACDGAPSAVALTREALSDRPNATAHMLRLPGRFPGARYDAIVIAELLYYLDDNTLADVARQIATTLRPGGMLVLCHHHVQFSDAAQIQAGLHGRFAGMLGGQFRRRRMRRHARWTLHALVKVR